MSSQAVKAVYRHAPDDLGPAAMLLLVTLADSVNEKWDWTYVPGIAALASKAHLSERAARNGMQELVARGVVTKPPRGRTQSFRLELVEPGPASRADSTGISCRFGGSAPSSMNQREPEARGGGRDGPSSVAWELANEARARKDIIVYRVNRTARDIQAILDSGAKPEDIRGAFDHLQHRPLTVGTLGFALSRFYLARTREREREEREQAAGVELPYVLPKGRSGNVIDFDALDASAHRP